MRRFAAALGLAFVAAGCKRQHHAVGPIANLPYPTCPGPETPVETLAKIDLRSGANDTRVGPKQAIVEHFRFEKRGCLYAAITRQEWPAEIADVEALYDEAMTPLRVWIRHTFPGSRRADGNADFKLYELRTTPLRLTHREPSGALDYEEVRGAGKAEVLIGPGRGNVSLWLRKAKLSPGQKTHAIGFDFRGVEKVERMALERLPDADVAGLGRVRVYTYLGKETVYANDDDWVVGDLAGLVPWEKGLGEPPPPMPAFGGIDPKGTP